MMNENFRAHDKTVQARATKAFRRKRILRKGARVTGIGCIFVAALVIGTGWWKPQVEEKHARPVATTHGVSSIQTERADMGNETGTQENKGPVRTGFTGELNDEELLAIFPEGSCFIAEVDGRKTLVFHDPAVRAKFFN